MGKIIQSQPSTLVLLTPGIEQETPIEDPTHAVRRNNGVKKTRAQSQVQPTRRRKVHFAEDDNSEALQIQIHSYEKDLSPEGIQEIWHTEEEYSQIKETNMFQLREHKRLLMIAATGNGDDDVDASADDDDFTWRGFEYILQSYPRSQLRRTHADNVLHFQTALNYDCPTALADYASNSSHAIGSIDRARHVGLEDEQVAQQIHSESPRVEDNEEEEAQEDNTNTDANQLDDTWFEDLKLHKNHVITKRWSTLESKHQDAPEVWKMFRKFFLCIELIHLLDHWSAVESTRSNLLLP